MTKRRAWMWGLTALVGVALLIFVFAYPLTHSPRFDALEPSLMGLTPLDDFRQVAAQHNIPLEPGPGKPGEPPDLYTNLIVPLDGSKWGKTLHLKFRNDTGLRVYAAVVGRDGKEERVWRTHW